jgi:hypothetical protein
VIDDDDLLPQLLDPEATGAVSVVILRAAEEAGQPRPAAGGSSVTLYENSALDDACVAALLESAVRLLAPHDAPVELVHALRQLPVPASFTTSPWLRDHRAVVLDAERPLELAGFLLRYRSHEGLLVTRKGEPQ